MLSFKKQIIGLLTAGALFVSACKPDSTTPTERVALGAFQSARLGSNITVRVDAIQDGRCPANVNCIWGGEAKVSLVLSKGNKSRGLDLILGYRSGKRADSTQISLSGRTYTVILREVNPYPVLPTSGQPQTAVVQVTKL